MSEDMPYGTAMTLRKFFLVPCSVALLSTLLASCGKETPRSKSKVGQQTDWPSGSGNLAEWGYWHDGIFAVLFDGTRKLELWAWAGDRLTQELVSQLPGSQEVVPAISRLCGLSFDATPDVEGSSYHYALFDLRNGSMVSQWEPPADRWICNAGASMNGRLIALFAKENVDAPNHDWEHPKYFVGLIDVPERSLSWVGELIGPCNGDVRRVAVSDDGRYVAIGGWGNGVALLSTQRSTVLWAKRPPSEVTSGYVVFSPDGDTVYAGGGEGCIYAMRTMDGQIIDRRYATTTGKSIYGHRISSLAASSDGRWVAAGTGPEGEAYLWNLQSGEVSIIRHGMGTVAVVAFSPDSTHLATVAGGMLKVWTLPEAAPSPETQPSKNEAE